MGGNLIPESSIGINFGLNINIDNFSSKINYFRNDISNLIDTRVIARKTNGQNVFGYVNIDKILTQGLEIQNSYDLSNDLLINFNYQLLYAFNKENLSKIREGNIYARNPDNLPGFQSFIQTHLQKSLVECLYELCLYSQPR